VSKVFFISANTTLEPYPVYPLGMAVVSSALTNAGHTVEQFDFLASGASISSLKKKVSVFEPDAVCLSIRNIDNVDSFTSDTEWYLDEVKQIIEEIRSCADVPIVCGGPGFSIMPDLILDYVGGDYGVQGEGEAAAIEILNKLDHGEIPDRITSARNFPLGPDDQESATYISHH
jgi:lipid biosynthesis B12-binding/radical SAM protein